MSTHTVTYTVTIRSAEMDGSPEDTAEIFDGLLREAIHTHTACDVVSIDVVDCNDE